MLCTPEHIYTLTFLLYFIVVNFKIRHHVRTSITHDTLLERVSAWHLVRKSIMHDTLLERVSAWQVYSVLLLREMTDKLKFILIILFSYIYFNHLIHFNYSLYSLYHINSLYHVYVYSLFSVFWLYISLSWKIFSIKLNLKLGLVLMCVKETSEAGLYKFNCHLTCLMTSSEPK